MPRFAALFSMLAPPDTEPLPYPFVSSDVAQLQRLCPGAAPIDGHTWGDLLLEPYSDALSEGVSITGRQVLHQRLASGVDDIDVRTAQLRTLMADPTALAALHTSLRPLRRAEVELAMTLYDTTPPPPPRWIAWTWLLPLALLAAIVAVVLSPAAWLAAGAVLFFLMAQQMRYSQQVDEWKRRLDALRMVLATTALLGPTQLPTLGQALGAAAADQQERSAASAAQDRLQLPGSLKSCDCILEASTYSPPAMPQCAFFP